MVIAQVASDLRNSSHQSRLAFHLSEAFDLKNEWFIQNEINSIIPDRCDAAYLSAVRHFKDNAAKVNESKEQVVLAAHELLGQAAKQLSTRNAEFQESLTIDQSERPSSVEAYLPNSKHINISQDRIVRRDLMEQLISFADQSLASRDSDQTRKTQR